MLPPKKKTPQAPPSALTKGIYGFETDPKKTPFGILNNQFRTDAIVKNGGWFNFDGNKMGTGDLSLKDMLHISKEIAHGEVFFVLSETDSSWDMPSGMDRSAPGKDYVLKTATWVIGKYTGIVRVRDDITKSSESDIDGIKYLRIPRNVVISGFNQKPKSNPAPIKDLSLDDAQAKATASVKKFLATKAANNPWMVPPTQGPPGVAGSGAPAATKPKIAIKKKAKP